MVNFSIQSSESQSIKHTSSSKCIFTSMRRTVAGIDPHIRPSFAIAFP